jgi:predicted transcriptional regulator
VSEFADLGMQRQRVKRTQLSVTVNAESAAHVNELATRYGMTKSAIIERLIDFDRQKRQEALMREGYEEMSAL